MKIFRSGKVVRAHDEATAMITGGDNHDDHDDVMQQKGFSHLLPFGKPRASRYKGPVTWSSS